MSIYTAQFFSDRGLWRRMGESWQGGTSKDGTKTGSAHEIGHFPWKIKTNYKNIKMKCPISWTDPNDLPTHVTEMEMLSS